MYAAAILILVIFSICGIVVAIKECESFYAATGILFGLVISLSIYMCNEIGETIQEGTNAIEVAITEIQESTTIEEKNVFEKKPFVEDETIEKKEPIVEKEKDSSVIVVVLSVVASAIVFVLAAFGVAIFFKRRKEWKEEAAILEECKRKEEASKIQKEREQLLTEIQNFGNTCYSKELKDALLYIAKGVAILDFNKKNTTKLYCYYIPEMLSIFKKSTELYQLRRISFQSEQEANVERAKYNEELLNAANLVKKVVHKKLGYLSLSMQIELDCDKEVLKGMSSSE